MIFNSSPGKKPDIKGYGRIVKISIYGNGKVAKGIIFATHHVFIVLETERSRFILLEVERCDNGKIHINMQEAMSLEEVIKKRCNKEELERFWRLEKVNTSALSVQPVIDKYHGREYHATAKSCRTFVNDICEACEATIRCTMSDEWWAFW